MLKSKRALKFIRFILTNCETKVFFLFLFSLLSSCSFSGKITQISSGSSISPINFEGLSVADTTEVEYGVASLKVNLGKAVNKQVSFNYYTQDQTAISGTDYIGVSGTATIAAGQTQAVIPVSITSNLFKSENKKFFFNISSALNSDISTASSIVQIQDNDRSPFSNITGISVRGSHGCGLSTTGGVKCWGYNSNGQLGDGTTSNSPIPVDVTGLASGIASISAGDYHTCALTTGGGVKCWGANSYGELGDGSTTQRVTPVDVSGLTSGIVSISAGSNHTCALTSGGGVKCWGYNSNGQLGDGTTTNSPTSVDVSGLTSGVSAVSSGGIHTCVVTTTGGAKCWGRNASGQIGDGTTADKLTSVNVTGLTSGVANISAGNFHTCAVTTTGGAKCWGLNSVGQLGDASTTNRTTSVNVTGLTSGIVSISAGSNHTCALTSGGGVKCWGENFYAEVGDGTYTQRTTQVDVSGLTSGVTSISLGANHSCALTTSGTIKCWGRNNYGQIGTGMGGYKTTSVDVTNLTSGVESISAGANHSCALTTTGGVKCWGSNSNGQLGNGTTSNSPIPVDVTGLTSGVASISAGFKHTCAVTTTGGAKCWGLNSSRQIGDGTATQRLTPVDVSGLTSGVASISAGNNHSCAVTTTGGAKCWGNNSNGELGDGTTTLRSTPVNVTGLTSGVASISAGWGHTCALTTSGGVKCWAFNSNGQLGNGTTSGSLTAVDVTGLTSGMISVSVGASYTCALSNLGGVKCWGDNYYGQLGDGTTTQRNSPVDFLGMSSGISAIAPGSNHNCVLTNTGAVKCVGYNGYGSLGNNSITDSLSAVEASALSLGVSKISSYAQGGSVCVVTIFGGGKCWGNGADSQLGNESDTTTPQTVVAP